MNRTFTIDSDGYSRYLFRRAVLPKLGWAAGAAGVLFAAFAFYS